MFVNAPRSLDLWRFPLFLLWLVFFIAGLAPEPVFVLLREAGGVLTQRALVNSPHAITIALAAYLAIFVYRRCRDAGDLPGVAQDKALQLGVVALVAFMPVDLGAILAAHRAPELQYRLLLYGAGLFKLVAWWSLLPFFIRYYLFRNDHPFSDMHTIFPSTHDKGAPVDGTDPASDRMDTEQPGDQE